MTIHNRYQRKGLCVGPLGFPQKEQAARNLESQLKEAEKNGIKYKRQFVTAKPLEVSEGERCDISVITTTEVDRDNEVVLASGADLTEFQKNPVITWGHDYSLMPIGRSLWVKFEPTRKKATQIKAKCEYAPRPEDHEGEWFPSSVFSLIQSGFLKGKSIGFLPREITAPSQKEVDQRPELADVKNVIRSWSLFEVAVATVPANQSALVEAVAKGELILPDHVAKSLGLELPEVVEFDKCWVWDDPEEEAIPMPKFSSSW